MKHILPLLGCLTVLLCMTACGKTAEVSAEASDAVISDPAEITFQVKFCNADAVTYIEGFAVLCMSHSANRPLSTNLVGDLHIYKYFFPRQ